jgi:Transposase, Mutator family
VRDNGHVKNKTIYLAIGVTVEGLKEVMALWITQTEGAKFWLQVVSELKNRGVTDIFIACVDWLKGFPEAIEVSFRRRRCSCVSCIWCGFAELRGLETAQGSRCGSETDLPGRDRVRSPYCCQQIKMKKQRPEILDATELKSKSAH